MGHPPNSSRWSRATRLAFKAPRTTVRIELAQGDSVGRYKQLIAVVLFLAVLFAIAELSGLREHFSFEYLHQTLLENKWSGLVIFVLLFAAGNLIQIPGWIFLAAAVLALGRTWGGIVSYVAASFSCAITYFIIRWVGGDALNRLKGKLATRILGQLHAKPVRSVMVLRILFQTLPALNYALALSGVGFRKYMLGTLLGLPLPIAVYCVLFERLAAFLGVPG